VEICLEMLVLVLVLVVIPSRAYDGLQNFMNDL
jgi:hypothetical protein